MPGFKMFGGQVLKAILQRQSSIETLIFYITILKPMICLIFRENDFLAPIFLFAQLLNLQIFVMKSFIQEVTSRNEGHFPPDVRVPRARLLNYLVRFSAKALG